MRKQSHFLDQATSYFKLKNVVVINEKEIGYKFRSMLTATFNKVDKIFVFYPTYFNCEERFLWNSFISYFDYNGKFSLTTVNGAKKPILNFFKGPSFIQTGFLGEIYADVSSYDKKLGWYHSIPIKQLN